MQIYPLSRKCEDALFDSNYRINFFIGAVRAGKTFVSCLRWIRFISTEVKSGEMCAIIGKSISTVEKNIISLLTELVGAENVKYNSTKNVLYIYGVKHVVVGATDEAAKNKIQGNTLKGALCDEVCLYPESFIKMLVSRMSAKGAKNFWTANPEGAYHYMRTEFILREEEINQEDIEKGGDGKVFRSWSFTMDDNLSLDEGYKRSLKSTLRGMYYDRLVLGKWVNAEGVVYDMYFDEDVIDKEPGETYGRVLNPSHIVNCNQILAKMGKTRFRSYAVSVDYGTANPTAFVMIGYDDYWGQKYVVKEYYYDSRSKDTKSQKTDAEYANDLVKFCNGYSVTGIYVDPSAASFKVELLRKGVFTIDANNDVLDGIRYVSTLLSGYDLLIDEGCVNLRREFQSYMWSEKYKERGIDTPVPMNDHLLDALRYGIYTIFGSHSFGIIGAGNRK